MRSRLLIIGLFFSFCSSAQQDEEKVFEHIEITAQFKGGSEKWKEYLNTHYNWDSLLLAEPAILEDSIFVRFIVYKTGVISDIKTAGNRSPALDEAIRQLLSRCPPWRPANACGRNVNAYRFLLFRIQHTAGISRFVFRDKEPDDFTSDFIWKEN